MNFIKVDDVKLFIPNNALRAVFDECDRYNTEETGGRILGTYTYKRKVLTINVNGIIEPGPATARTASYLKQDGVYQERIFREVEQREPSVEHLGNWHTHHVNGLPHLSEGDIVTYRRTVEHQQHNTDFFYALLVTEKKYANSDLQRYSFKNYLLRRGNREVYEIPSSALTITDAPLIWPLTTDGHEDCANKVIKDEEAFRQNRILDRDIISQFYPNIKTFKSPDLGICWRGTISLLDGSDREIVVIEDDSGVVPQFSVVLRDAREDISGSVQALSKMWFASCREALLSAERSCNSELYDRKPTRDSRRRRWIF